MLWRRLILKNNGVITNTLDVSSLSKVTDGYTPGHMLTAITQVLTERRIQTLSKKPLQSVEFIAPLARIDPIYKEEEEAFKVSYLLIQNKTIYLLSILVHIFLTKLIVLYRISACVQDCIILIITQSASTFHIHWPAHNDLCWHATYHADLHVKKNLTTLLSRQFHLST